MARSRSKMHLRFRHSFPLVGHFLHFTVSKKGVSLNAHAGWFSKSWGTRGDTTTVDAPGHLGLFWRKQTRRTHQSADEVAVKHDHKWLHLSLALVVLVAIVEAWHIWVHPFSQVTVVGHPLNTLLLLAGALAFAILIIHHMGIASGIILFILALGGAYLQWQVFHATAWNDVRTTVTRPTAGPNTLAATSHGWHVVVRPVAMEAGAHGLLVSLTVPGPLVVREQTCVAALSAWLVDKSSGRRARHSVGVVRAPGAPCSSGPRLVRVHSGALHTFTAVIPFPIPSGAYLVRGLLTTTTKPAGTPIPSVALVWPWAKNH